MSALTALQVALRKESVDRNKVGFGANIAIPVALRKESVDRNYQQAQLVNGVQKSLSARRAWIEILLKYPCKIKSVVALRKESVDRNMPIPPAA